MRPLIILISVMTTALSFCANISYANVENSCEGISMLSEEKVWEYIFTGSEYSIDPEYSIAFHMQFVGEEEHGGKNYGKFCYVGDEVRWSYQFDPETGIFVYAGDKTVLPNTRSRYFLMREENGKIYICMTDYIAERIVDWISNVEPMSEVLIYDFNKTKNESFTQLCGDMDSDFELICSWFQDVIVKESDFTEIDGKSCRTQFIEGGSSVEVIEGIGVVAGGIVPFIDLSPMFSGGNGGGCYLNRVYKNGINGEIIYRSPHEIDIENLGVADGVVAVTDVDNDMRYANNLITAESDIAVMDMRGRCMAEGRGSVSTAGLQPGVYVARTAGQSLKIVVR